MTKEEYETAIKINGKDLTLTQIYELMEYENKPIQTHC